MKKYVVLLFFVFPFLVEGQNIFPGSGNAGIGTSTPGAKLEIVADANTELKFSGSGAANILSVNEFYILSNAGLNFGSNGTNSQMFLSNGNLGIGTGTPGAKLEVNGISRISNGGSLQLGAYNTSTDNFGYVSAAGQTNGIGLKFLTTNGSASNTGVTRMTILNNGNVGIGSSNPDYLLTVNGTIHAKEVKIDLSIPVPDYVFEPNYKLRPLESVKQYIDQNRHLPEVPSASEMGRDGVNVSEMNMLLLKKVEEMTLYLIELKASNDQLKARVTQLEKGK